MKRTVFTASLMILILFLILPAQVSSQKQNLMDVMSSTPPISVTIGGEFIINGTVPAYSGERVDNLISRIFNEYKIALYSTAQDRYSLDLIERRVNSFALRGIKLVRRNGESLLLDLQKFRLTGNFIDNPYLMNDDVLIFPALDLDRNFVEISGAVNGIDKTNILNPQPIKFQYIEGDKLSDAILFAGGINPAYESVKNVEISRLSYDGNEEIQLIIGIDEDFSLQPGDRIKVLADETQKRDFKVYVQGEVNRPGFHYITKNNTTLRDVILKAGGFTNRADLNRSEVIRGENVLNQPFFSREYDLMMMQRMANISLEDSSVFLIDNTLRFTRASGILNFNEVLDTASPTAKFTIKDGDYIYIPERHELLYVFGQVLKPGYIEFRTGEDYQYYVDQAGGLGKTARGDLYLIKGKTRAWIQLEEDSDYIIEPGDFIWAAKEPYRDFDYYLIRIGSVATIIGSVATVLLLFLQAFK